MKSEANLNWHICGVKQKVLFRYNKKPSAEKNYNIMGKYNRVFYQCEACDHIWAKHYFKIKNIYNKTYLDLTYKDTKGVSNRFNKIINLTINKSDNKNRAIRIDKFLNRKKANLLDVGSGIGVFLYEMKKKGYKAKGLDLDKRYANFLKKKEIKVFVSKIENLNIKEKFDLITFNKVLEHVKNPSKFLKNSLKFLKKSGLIYIEVPDSKARLKGKFSGEFCLDHLQLFSIESLVKLTKSCDLIPLRVERIIEPSNKFTVFGFFKIK